MTFALILIGSLAAFLLCQFAFARLATEEDHLAAEAMAKTKVYSREGAIFWLDQARHHEDRASVFRRVATWPLRSKDGEP